MPTAADKEDFKKQLALNYIDYNDYKVNSIITGYIVQTYLYLNSHMLVNKEYNKFLNN
jgi:hypothetical protein